MEELNLNTFVHDVAKRLRLGVKLLASGLDAPLWVCRAVLSVEEQTPMRVIEAIAHSRMRACIDPETSKKHPMYRVFEMAFICLEKVARGR